MPSQIRCGSAIETNTEQVLSVLDISAIEEYIIIIKLRMSIMALFYCSYLRFFRAFEVGSLNSISRSCFSLLSVLSTSTDNRDFSLFS